MHDAENPKSHPYPSQLELDAGHERVLDAGHERVMGRVAVFSMVGVNERSLIDSARRLIEHITQCF